MMGESDIHSEQQAQLFVKRNAEILEMIATGQSASDIYDAIALMYEARHPGLRCSLLELKGDKLKHGGAPSLPKEYCDAVNGLQVGPCVGSCGTSTYTGKRVLVENIDTDPKWAKIKQVALPHGMRCCWSEPIKDYNGIVLGAFGMYYNHPALPNGDELADLQSAGRLAGIIMERDHREVALRQSEKKYRRLSENSPAVVYQFEMDSDGAFTFPYINDAVTSIMGIAAEDIMQDSAILLGLVHPEDQDGFFESILKSAKSLKPYHSVVRYLKNEEERWLDVRSTPDKMEGGIILWDGIFVDITDKIKSERALKESEKKYRALFENSNDGIILHDLKGIIQNTNNKIEQMLGYEKNELIGMSIQSLHPKSEIDLSKRAFEQIMRVGYTILDSEFKTKDGRLIQVNINANIFDDSAGMVHGIIRDISEQKKLEAKLQQAKKLESIGRLAGGIAHDFNNILSPIMGFTELSIDDLPKNHPVQENLADILDGAIRARDLVKRILLFSRQKDLVLKPTILKPIIKETLKLLRSSIPANIIIRQELYNGEDHVLCDATEIHEIVMNLCTNAFHALEEKGGTIKVGLNKTDPNPDLMLPACEYICISVLDTGTGIPSDIADQIFNPYFTTKEVGKGSGLGLSVVYGIVKRYKGDISVKINPGKGSVFNVFLPVTSQLIDLELEQKQDKSMGGTETILFVDDERSIVKFNVSALSRRGYEITGVQDSSEALALFKADPQKYNLIITDMAMPGLTGTQLAKKILKIRPNIPIIICSGYSVKLDPEKAKKLNVKAIIDKPILIDELITKVRQILG